MEPADIEKNNKNIKKSLTDRQDLLKIYSRQIEQKAFELQFGNLIVQYKVRNGEVKEAHVLREEIKLRPF